jgi:hypothetical protein
MAEVIETGRGARDAEEVVRAARADGAGEARDDARGAQVKETFTQAQLDAIVAARLARERKGTLTPEESRAYRDFLGHRKADAEKAAEAIKAARAERDAAIAKLNDMENRHAALNKGVPLDRVDAYTRLAEACGKDGEPFDEALNKALAMFPLSPVYNGVPGSGGNPPPALAGKRPKRPEGVYAF